MNHNAPSEETLHGRWYRSEGEDTSDALVYRNVPVVHGRAPAESLQLNPDSTAVLSGPGRDDRSAHEAGEWTYDSKAKQLTVSLVDGTKSEFKVLGLDDGKLTLAKLV